VTDSELNKYAIDVDTYANPTNELIGFIKGHRVPVTYYQLLNQGGSNMRQNVADYPTTRNVLDTEYRRIANYEMTFPKGFDIATDTAKASLGVTGEAMLYPGMNPSIGDIFTCGLGDGRIGVFQVSSVSTQSFRADRVWTIDFTLQSFADSSDIDPISGSVTEKLVFEKTNYFGSTKSLLSETTYLSRQKMKTLREILIVNYFDQFYDEDVGTIMRSDGVYDETVATFITGKTSVAEIHIRPKLFRTLDPKIYNRTIYGRFINRYNTSLSNLFTTSTDTYYYQTDMGVFVTELVQRKFVQPNQVVGGYPYVMSAAFYVNDTANMSAWDTFIMYALTNRKIGDLDSFITTYLETVDTLSPSDQFYRVPLYIHCIDIGLQSTYREIDAPGIGLSS